MSPVHRHPRRRSLPGRWLSRAAIVLALAPALAGANPIPDKVAREMNARPGRWLRHPTPEDERGLVNQFGQYGFSRMLLTPDTIELLERHFDRFAGILVASQRPLYAPSAELQRWYRERADKKQSAAMKSALREWLVADVTEAPWHGGSRLVGSDPMVEDEIWNARLLAAEALGDWRDPDALPSLRALLARQSGSSAVLARAIYRVTHPGTADFLAVDRHGRITLGRSIDDLESMAVTSTDKLEGDTTWRADRAGVERIWTALRTAREVEQRHRGGLPMECGSVCPKQIRLHFLDGTIGTFEYSRDRWRYREAGRPGFRMDVADTALMTTVLEELSRAGIVPQAPRLVEESVTLFLDAGQLRVRGLYTFEGKPPEGRTWIEFPIPTDGGLGPPQIEEVVLRSVDPLHPRLRQRLPVTFEQHDTTCLITLTTGNAKGYRLEFSYRQPLEGNSAKYLITTARAWGCRVHRAWFQVIIDGALGEPHFDLPFREAQQEPGSRRFLFDAARFRPDEDLVVSW